MKGTWWVFGIALALTSGSDAAQMPAEGPSLEIRGFLNDLEKARVAEEKAAQDAQRAALEKAESEPSNATPKKFVLAVGDSITAGMFADSYLTRIQDSAIPPGFGFLRNRLTLSWSAGQKIQSIYMLTKEKHPAIHVMNVAVPGAKTDQLSLQLDLAKKLLGQNGVVAMATLWIGANDVCDGRFAEGLPDEQMRANLRKAFAKLSALRPNEALRVIVPDVPNIPDLGLPDVSNQKTWFGITCGELQSKYLRSCPTMKWKTESEYQAKSKVIDRKNQLIREESLRAMKTHPNLEILTLSGLSERMLKPENLAWDCFHPNRDAHEAFARTVWSRQPWH